MAWLRHFALFVVFVAALVRPAAASAFSSAADVNESARVGCVAGVRAEQAVVAGGGAVVSRAAACVEAFGASESRVCAGESCGLWTTCFVAGTSVDTSTTQQAIETVAVGQRVPAGPGLVCDGRALTGSVRVVLELVWPTTGRVVMLRSRSWLAVSAIRASEPYALEDEELGHAVAVVRDIAPFEVPAGEGCVVTGTVEHPTTAVVDLSFERGSDLHVTPIHPVFVVEAGGFLPAGLVRPGQHFVDRDTNLVEVTSASLRATSEQVYNLEVAGAHTYRVGDLGLWVHNQCAPAAEGTATRALVATDLGLAPSTALRALEGTVTNAGTTRIISVGYIEAAEGSLLPQLRSALPNMLSAARAEGVTTLQIEASFANPALERFAISATEAFGGTYSSAGGRDLMTFVLSGAR